MSLSSADLLLAANALPISFNLLLTLAAVGLPIVSGMNEFSARSQGQVFYKKSAQQVAPLGLA